MFGFLLLASAILMITVSETCILLCYFHLCAEVSQDAGIQFKNTCLFLCFVILASSTRISERRWMRVTWMRGLRLSLACTQAVLQESSAPGQSRFRYDLETLPTSLFCLFVRVYADLRTVKTMNFWCNEANVQ